MLPLCTTRPRRRTALLCATTLGLVGLLSPAAFGATRQVAPTGADAGSCGASACSSLSYAYGQASSGDVINLAPGVYPAQDVPVGSKTVTFRGSSGTVLRELDNSADNATFDGIEVDANFTQTTGFENHDSANVTFKNGRIGNITDEKGVLITGTNFTFDNVTFHDVRLTAPEIHNECVYALGVEGMVVRNSTFYACATMDLYYTYGDWWTPKPPAYGHVTIENNVFAHSTQIEPDSWHAYSLYIGHTGSGVGSLDGWTVRNNTFEIAANIAQTTGSGNRWVGNVGSWTCTSVLTYKHNVGDTCGGSGKAVNPASSSQSSTAPFRWVDPKNNNFRVKAGSPAIDQGDPADHPAGDRDGLDRGSRPDAGAYEFGATAPAPPGVAPTPPPTPTPAAPIAAPGGKPGGSSSPGGDQSARTVTTDTHAASGQIRSARLSAATICASRRRKGCPSSATVQLTLAHAARVSIRLQRIRPGHRATTVRAFKLTVKDTRTARIRARGLRAGSYRILISATNAGGTTSRVILRLRVR